MDRDVAGHYSARTGPLVLCIIGTLIAGGLGFYLIIEAPADLPALARTVTAITAGAMTYFLGIVGYCRRVDREQAAQRAAEETERIRSYQDRFAEVEAAVNALTTVAQHTAQESHDQMEAESRIINLLQSISKKLDRVADPRTPPGRARSEERHRARPVESISDEFRAYLAGRESLEDGRGGTTPA